MKSKWLAVSAFLQANILAADAQIFGLTDPRLCYLLDGILFFYAIIVTALFFREKLIKKARKNGEVEDNYSHLHPDTRAMHSHTDNKRGNAKLDNSALYQALEKDKLNEPYSGINVKQQLR
ncbi:T-cell surface glycoprotein CD3 zeta chain isoform X2 [Hyperolius riggenbachi]|uniref:T-cell surface glycoprotein CD3 zeta chain isoform X2 n=1 Tax=Hyperolius riggenbachi TaxID=752182 RepID=UPI0035A299C6